MSDIILRKAGRVGRVTLNRPRALNAVTLGMIHDLAAVLPEWAADDSIAMVVIDAAGEKAFSAGGDIADIYAALTLGDHDIARRFWRDEYRLNAALSHFPKPVASFLQGFTMGGGVGIGCHVSHRVVGDTSRIAMPECGIGLVPDVGGSLLLARAPGHLGEYLGTTGHRMGPGDALLARFADYYLPERHWPRLIAELEETGDCVLVEKAAEPPPRGTLAALTPKIDAHFGAPNAAEILAGLHQSDDDWAQETWERLAKPAPLALAAAVEIIRMARATGRIEDALLNEYRFAHRIAAQGDFREGIRAAIIDRDNAPEWSHAHVADVSTEEISAMLSPLGRDDLNLEDT